MCNNSLPPKLRPRNIAYHRKKLALPSRGSGNGGTAALSEQPQPSGDFVHNVQSSHDA